MKSMFALIALTYPFFVMSDMDIQNSSNAYDCSERLLRTNRFRSICTNSTCSSEATSDNFTSLGGVLLVIR